MTFRRNHNNNFYSFRNATISLWHHCICRLQRCALINSAMSLRLIRRGLCTEKSLRPFSADPYSWRITKQQSKDIQKNESKSLFHLNMRPMQYMDMLRGGASFNPLDLLHLKRKSDIACAKVQQMYIPERNRILGLYCNPLFLWIKITDEVRTIQFLQTRVPTSLAKAGRAQMRSICLRLAKCRHDTLIQSKRKQQIAIFLQL